MFESNFTLPEFMFEINVNADGYISDIERIKMSTRGG
jgi:hypothetical protein